jgi:hypothetical protein
MALSKKDYDRLREAKQALPAIAASTGSKAELREAFISQFPDVPAILGPVLFDKWAWDHLRSLKEKLTDDEPDQAQLPYWGSFGDALVERAQWEKQQYRQYYIRYTRMAESGKVKADRLAAEYYEKFGEGISDGDISLAG